MTTTNYLELDDQATGANNNTWGDVADANMAILEQAIARVTGIATTGGTTTLTSSQNRYPVIEITGVLASNATIQVKTQEKNWRFLNSTTGAFTVTVKTASGTGKTIPRGRTVELFCDGTNVRYLRRLEIPAAQAGGTVDVITATFEPPTIAADLVDGTMWTVEAAGANTSTTPTFNPDGTGALTIKKRGGQALVAGEIRAAGHKLQLMYDASGGHVELLNPAVVFATDAQTKTGTDTTLPITAANLTAKEATVAEYLANTADRILTTDIVYSAAAEVSWTYTATYTPDMATFINAVMSALTGNLTLANPTNQAGSVGKSGHITFVQDATGGRTITFGTNWKFAGGIKPTLSTAGGSFDCLFYKVLASGTILASLTKAFA